MGQTYKAGIAFASDHEVLVALENGLESTDHRIDEGHEAVRRLVEERSSDCLLELKNAVVLGREVLSEGADAGVFLLFR